MQVKEYTKISVLMPAYNAEKYIGAAIESILNQSFIDFEFIIIDDCSNDNTWKIIEEYASKDKRIFAIKNEINLKISKTRNKLISLSKGKYILWQDADDISLPKRIECQYIFMESNPNIGICGASITFFNGETKLSERHYSEDDKVLRSLIFRQSPVSQPVSIIRKEVFKKIGMFDENLSQAEDLDLSLRIGMYYNFSNIEKPLLLYRFHENSITTSKLKENIKYTLLVRRRAVSEYGYVMSPQDKIVYCITFLFQFVPSKLTYTVFNYLRNK